MKKRHAARKRELRSMETAHNRTVRQRNDAESHRRLRANSNAMATMTRLGNARESNAARRAAESVHERNSRNAANRLRMEQNRPTSDRTQAAISRHRRLNNQSIDSFTVPSETKQAEIEKKLAIALSGIGLDECTCAVCDRLALRKDSKVVLHSDAEYLKKMKMMLQVPSDVHLPNSLLTQYDCSDISEEFDGTMMSRQGFKIQNGVPGFSLHVCVECDHDLGDQKFIKTSAPPRFAIANHFFVGSLPECLSDLSWIETLMTQLITVVAPTRVMRGGAHRSIRSHSIVFDASPGPPATLLPRTLQNDCVYRVILAGSLTVQQEDRIRKLHKVRHSKVKDILEFYKKNNELYRGVNVSYADFPNTQACVPNEIFVRQAEVSSGLVDAVDSQSETLSGRSDSTSVSTLKDQCTVIERNVLFVPDNATPVNGLEEHVLQEMGRKDDNDAIFEVYHSSAFAQGCDGIEAKMFAHLFPFGRGHPGEKRRTKVSKLDCIRYYSMLSSRRFAQDKTFMMICFDRLSLENMYTKTFFTSMRMPGVFQSFENITSEEMRVALMQNEKRARGLYQNEDGHRVCSNSSSTTRFMKSVRIGSMAVWGSNAEREVCRRRAFAYQARYGQPALFVTINPNTDNSLAMAYYAGKLSINSLFESDLEKLPTRMKMKEIAMCDDVAAARLFSRTVSSFIGHVLGFCTKNKVSKQGGGHFGEVKAYFGMVETQGRGTLHAHFLVWLNGTPSNSEEFTQAADDPVNGQLFKSKVLAFADAVVTNNFPIPLSTHVCVNCECSGQDMIALPIPSRSRSNIVEKLKRRQHELSCIKEPLLLACQRCAHQTSSQHFIRQALLRFRPTVWPEYNSSLSTSQLQDRIQLEQAYHDSLEDTEYHILSRENMCNIVNQCIATEDCRDSFRDFLTSFNSVQNVYTPLEDNPANDDEMFRAIEMLPPDLNHSRLTEKAKTFMISVLVALVNMHWWSHTGSCFKMNRRSGNDQICRYMFPRDRAATIKFSKSCIVNKRSVGSEYINGYNPTILKTFKCNHDIQLLLGGRDATNRIYYACKYVTKPQHNADCKAALALASFHRRKAREKEELQNAGATTERKRVTSMVYCMTNKQEIAGPLASFYILKGSCSYESHACVSVPLQAIIDQVCGAHEHSCRLVPQLNAEDPTQNSFEDQSAHTASTQLYNKVSYLDDYIYRPQNLESYSLYEYSMQFFRRKRTPKTSSSVLFHEDHPVHHSFCVGVHTSDVIPIISGPRLPYYASIDPNDFQLLSKHAKVALVLFKSFRSLTDIIGCNSATPIVWSEAYEQWKSARSPFITQIMNNMYDYHIGREISEDCHGQEYDVESPTDAQGGTDDAYFASDVDNVHLYNEDEHVYHKDDYESDRHTIAFLEHGSTHDSIQDIDSLDPAIFAASRKLDASAELVIEEIQDRQLMDQMASSTTATYETHTSRFQSECNNQRDQLRFQIYKDPKQLRDWIKNSRFEGVSVSDVGLIGTNTAAISTMLETRIIEILHESNNGMVSWKQRNVNDTRMQDIIAVGEFASLTVVSESFSLNAKQHAAFMTVGNKMMSRWLSKIQHHEVSDKTHRDELIDIDSGIRQNQILLFLGGEGGTGKSRVIDAIQALCVSWGQQTSLLKTAMTGKAATLISGRTFDGFLKQLGNKSNKTLSLIETIIIDEVSMMGKADLVKLQAALRKLKVGVDIPFGGINVILAGDFLQLPPVRRDPLYVDPATKSEPSLMDTDGYNLWRSITDAIVLTENMRFRNDPEWGEGCRLARKGVWTDSFVRIINSRLLFAGPQSLSTEPGMVEDYNNLLACLDSGRTKFVTPDNLTRKAINDCFVASAARKLPNGHYPIRIRANFQGALNGLSDTDIRTIMSCPDSSLGRMAPYLDLIPGMPIQITQNVRPQKGIANGTTGILQDVMFPQDTQFKIVRDSRLDIAVLVPNKRPVCAMVKIDKPLDGVMPIPDSQHTADLIPLFHDTRAYTSSSFKLTPSSNGEPRSREVRPEQFPFVCAAASTVYKVQGETLTSMVIVNWKAKLAMINKPQQAYLMLSRVVSRNALLILQEFTPAIRRFSKPPIHALQEEARLVQLSNETLCRFDCNFFRDADTSY